MFNLPAGLTRILGGLGIGEQLMVPVHNVAGANMPSGRQRSRHRVAMDKRAAIKARNRRRAR